jgi:ketosteroid isomerase-like protein
MNPTDLRAAEQSLVAFFDHLDEQRYDALLALMTPDAVWHRHGKTLRGTDQIMAALRERSATQRIRHVLTNLLEREAPAGEIVLTHHMTAYKYDDGQITRGPVAIRGPFRFSMVRTRWRRHDQRWLIAEQAIDAEFDFLAP